MNTSFFSIITCTRNSEKFIRRNIESVKMQTYRNFEQVFIDGDSIDSTEMVIKEYLRHDPGRYHLFVFPPKGISEAFNRGIEVSRGRYILFLNSDDSFYDRDVLADVHKHLQENTDKDWIHGIINVTEENGDRIGRFPKYKIFEYSSTFLLKLFNYIPHQAVFMKRKVFEKFGLFDEGLSSKMDYEYWLRIADKTNWQFIDRVISNYTIRKGAKTSSRKNRQENEANLKIVQRRHLNSVEYALARIVYGPVHLLNRTTR